MIGGDFNLVRSALDKSSRVADERLIRAFNDFIGDLGLIEIHRGGTRFTWTNKQENPVQSNIDRVLVATEWESRFPLTSLSSLTRLGSDHCPLLLDSEESITQLQR